MRSRVRGFLRMACLAALAATAGGCTQGLAWLTAQWTPPKKIEALYEPPKGKTILVFVDDRPNVSYAPIKSILADKINRKLKDAEVARDTVNPDRVQDLSTRREFPQMAISEVGRKLDADLVLYVQIEAFALHDSPDSLPSKWQGKLVTSIRMIDAREQVKLWPKGVPRDTGYRVPPLLFEPTENPSPLYGQAIADALAEQMADRIVNCFHTHYDKPDPHHDRGKRLEMN